MAFQTGQSGNPAGRPKGSVNRQLRMLREAAEKVLPLVLERALAGDADAQKLLIERGIPRMKPVTPEEPFSLPTGSLATQMQALLQQVADGTLSVSSANEVMELAASTTKAQEAEAKEQMQQRVISSSPGGGCTYLAKLQGRLHTP